MNKGSRVVNLSGLQVHQDAHCEQQPHSEPHDHRRKGLKLVCSFCLLKSPDTVPCLEFLDTAVWMSLPFAHPDPRKHLFMSWPVCNVKDSWLIQGSDLQFHCFHKPCHIWAGHCFVVGWIISHCCQKSQIQAVHWGITEESMLSVFRCKAR